MANSTYTFATAFTADFHPLVKQNLYQLIWDFLLVLGTDPDRGTLLSESPSVIARKYRKAGNDLRKQRRLRTECRKNGQVYMLVCSPRPMDLDRMWFAGEKGTETFEPLKMPILLLLLLLLTVLVILCWLVRDPEQTLPVKIGQTGDTAIRIKQHNNCGIRAEPLKMLPEINYVYLLEHMLHELFVAHQHDLLCGCPGGDAERNHIEVFWFERLSGGKNFNEDFQVIVDALSRDMERCQAFVESLGERLSLVHAPLA